MSYRERDLGDGWKVKEIALPDGRRLERRYFYKTKPAPKIELKTKLAKQLSGYALIEKDLRSSITWLEKINELMPESAKEKDGALISGEREVFDIIKGLWVSALTFYGKCFTQTEGRKIKLERRILDQKYREKHDTFMHMRNNFAAHAGVDAYEQARIILALNPKKYSKKTPRILTELSQQDYFSTEEENDLIVLAKHVREKVIDKKNELSEKIVMQDVTTKGIEYWYKKAKL